MGLARWARKRGAERVEVRDHDGLILLNGGRPILANDSMSIGGGRVKEMGCRQMSLFAKDIGTVGGEMRRGSMGASSRTQAMQKRCSEDMTQKQ